MQLKRIKIMSEIGDTFKIIKEQNKVKKQSNLDYSTALLLETKFQRWNYSRKG